MSCPKGCTTRPSDAARRYRDGMPGTLYITGDSEADGLLNRDGTALLIGMLLDQQVPMEWAFAGPVDAPRPPRSPGRRQDRRDGLRGLRRGVLRPSRRFTASRPRWAGASTSCAPCSPTSTTGTAENLWAGVTSGAELYRRLRALPGYGDEKSRIFVAILAKTQGVAPEGWQQAAGKFGDDAPRSVADIHDAASLARGPRVEEGPEGRAARQAGPPGRRPLTRPPRILRSSDRAQRDWGGSEPVPPARRGASVA